MLGNEETLQKIPKEKVCKMLTFSVTVVFLLMFSLATYSIHSNLNQWFWNDLNYVVDKSCLGFKMLTLQNIDVNESLRDFQKRMYSAHYMTLAVISRGKTKTFCVT